MTDWVQCSCPPLRTRLIPLSTKTAFSKDMGVSALRISNSHRRFSSSKVSNPACLRTVPTPWLWSNLKRLSKRVCKCWKGGCLPSMILTPGLSDDILRFRPAISCSMLRSVYGSPLCFSHLHDESAEPLAQDFFVICDQNIGWTLDLCC